MNLRSILTSLLLAPACLLLASAQAFAGDDWKPVDQAQLSMKTPVVEKDADAEAIFWEVRIEDATQDLIFSHYIRIKIFTERGKESQSQVDIPYLDRNRVKDIAGRTVKQDGTIVELKKDAIFERTIIKANGIKVKAKSFAMPAVEPGVIIEYRWREVRSDQSANYVRLHFQRGIPVQMVKYYVKPFAYARYGMRAQSYNAREASFVKEKDGFFSTTMTNMPAFREEPHMPPEDQVRAWALLYYSKDRGLVPEQYWKDRGRNAYEELKSFMKLNDDVKKAALEVTGDATTPEQKLERIYEFCHSKIKNVNDDASGMTEADRAKVKKNESPSDTLKRGAGTAIDIDMLFGALATAAGFQARIAFLGDRGDFFFNFRDPNIYFLRRSNVAVKVGEGWRFFEPSSAYCPFGMLRWEEEGEQALIIDPKETIFAETPLSPPEKSKQKRTAEFTLSADGTLEGDARIEYTGQLAMEKKEENDDDSQQEREQTLLDMVKAHMSTAELSNIRIENVTDPAKPFVYSFHVRVPGYAQRTGKRLFLQPAFFEKGIPALFSSSDRTHQIYFHYPWMEEDNVRIKVPAGYALDNADAPAPFAAQNIVNYNVKIQVEGNSEALIYKRTFSFNGLIFPKQSYQGLKQVFEMLHEHDNHTITLKQAATN